jgi:hypothetical protein
VVYGSAVFREIDVDATSRGRTRAAWMRSGSVGRRVFPVGPAVGSRRRQCNEALRRPAYVAGLLNKRGAAVIVDAISPDPKVREEIRAAAGKFAEVYVKAYRFIPG